MVRQPPPPPGPENELVQFYKSIPIITRVLLTLSISISLLTHLKVFPYDWFAYSWENVFINYRVWTPITTFFINSVGFNFVIDMIYLYQNSSSLERETYYGKQGDYFYYIILVMLASMFSIPYLGTPYLSSTLLMAICTLWANNNQEQMVSFYFGIRFKARYLPFVLTGVEFVLSARLPLPSLYGVILGYAYQYITGPFIESTGYNLLKTPILIERLFPANEVYHSAGFTVTPPPDRKATGPSMSGGYNWGKGNRLGE